jgi:hypothetical protein
MIQMTDRTEVTEIPLNKIKAAPWQPRELFDKDKIKALGESLNEKGIIQPIVVRKDKTGEGYELIAGERRFRAWSYTGKATIPAVIKDVDEFTAKEMSFAENWHREDLSDTEKAKFLSDLYEEGIKKRRYSQVSDFAKNQDMPERTVYYYMKFHKDRNSIKNPQVLQNIKIDELDQTSGLKNDPISREKILKIRTETPNILKQEDLRTVSRGIIETPQKSRSEVIKLISSEKLEPKNVERFVKVLKESPADIQDKLLKQEITPEEAESVRIFKTSEQRDQIIKEKKILREDFKDQEERHIKVRKQMADDVESGKVPSTIHPRFDLTGRDDEASAKRTLERYQNIHIEVLSYRADHIMSIKNKDMRDQCIDIIKRTTTHCNQVLHEIEELNILLKYR